MTHTIQTPAEREVSILQNKLQVADHLLPPKDAVVDKYRDIIADCGDRIIATKLFDEWFIGEINNNPEVKVFEDTIERLDFAVVWSDGYYEHVDDYVNRGIHGLIRSPHQMDDKNNKIIPTVEIPVVQYEMMPGGYKYKQELIKRMNEYTAENDVSDKELIQVLYQWTLADLKGNMAEEGWDASILDDNVEILIEDVDGTLQTLNDYVTQELNDTDICELH